MKTSRRFIIFQIGINFFGVEIQYVKEIVKNVPMEKCINSFSEMDGILNMDDCVISVVDLHKKFYTEYLPVCGDVCYIIFILGKKLIAVPVNGVERYCDVTNDCLLPVPVILETGGGQCIQQIINFEGRLIPVLSIELLFEETEEGGIAMRLNTEESIINENRQHGTF